MLAVSIEANSAAATGASSRSSTAALPAGAATTTASTASCRPSGTGPTASSKPVGVRRSVADRRSGAHLEATAGGQLLGQPGQSTGDAGEHRPGRRRAGHRRGRPQQRTTVAGQPVGQRRHRRLQRQFPGPSGIDAAEQRVDQPVHHLLAEPTPDQLADRDVLGQRRVRPAGRLGLDPGQRRVAEHPAGPHRCQIRRDPDHRPGRQGVVGAPAVQQRRGGQGCDHRQPRLGGGPDPFRAAGQHRLGAHVDPGAGHPHPVQLAADPVAGLQ